MKKIFPLVGVLIALVALAGVQTDQMTVGGTSVGGSGGNNFEGDFTIRELTYGHVIFANTNNTLMLYSTWYGSCVPALEVGRRFLLGADGVCRVNWESHLLYDNSGTNSVEWGVRELRDNAGISSVDWNSRELEYGGGNTALSWGVGNKKLYADSTIATVDWDAQTLTGGGGLSVDWNVRALYNAGLTKSVDYTGSVLYDGYVKSAVEWNARYLSANTTQGGSDSNNVMVAWDGDNGMNHYGVLVCTNIQLNTDVDGTYDRVNWVMWGRPDQNETWRMGSEGQGSNFVIQIRVNDVWSNAMTLVGQ